MCDEIRSGAPTDTPTCAPTTSLRSEDRPGEEEAEMNFVQGWRNVIKPA